jgi:hypothetical protein
MTISIPTIVSTLLTNLKASLQGTYDSASGTYSYEHAPYLDACRAADYIEQLTDLIDVTVLSTSAPGTTTTLVDTGAYTGTNSLVGATIKFVGNDTTQLAGVKAIVKSNTTGVLTFTTTLSNASTTGDQYGVEYTALDKLIDSARGKSGVAGSSECPYGDGRTLTNLVMSFYDLLGAAKPASLTTASADPFDRGSPFMGNGGHASAEWVAYILTDLQAKVAAYTKPHA